MNKSKPVVGQIVYSLNVGNRAGRPVNQKLTPMTVTKVGSKYFECKEDGWNKFKKGVQFLVDSWQEKTEYCADYKLFETESEWNDKKEREDFYDKFAKLFSYKYEDNSISLETLREINLLIINDKG